jgi:transposase
VDNIGIDLHKRSSQICTLTAGGELLEHRIESTRERFAAILAGRPRARILIEASTESEWVARCLEELGHEVIVADPNYAPMYAQRTRKVKTDRRDARALAEACRLGAYRPAHRTSDAQWHVRTRVVVREALVQTRSRYISLVGALLRRQGIHLGGGGAAAFPVRVARLPLPEALQQEIAPLQAMLKILNRRIQCADLQLENLVASDPRAHRLCTVPGVGPVTAATFVATVDRVERFAGAHQLEAYLGLVPRERSSGEKQCRGRITKAGNGRARWLLVEAAWSILRYKKPETLPLRLWADRIAARRGKFRAAVALARRLAGILYAMLRDGTVYQPERLGAGAERRPAA